MNTEFSAVFTLTLTHPPAGFMLFPLRRQWSLHVLCIFFLAASEAAPPISGSHLLLLGPGALSYVLCLALWMLSITPFLLQ